MSTSYDGSGILPPHIKGKIVGRGHVHRYRKKPIVIEAIQWLGWNWGEVCKFIPVPSVAVGAMDQVNNLMLVKIQTKEGTMSAQPGDYIIKGIQNEYYPVKPDIFEATYEVVEDGEDP